MLNSLRTLTSLSLWFLQIDLNSPPPESLLGEGCREAFAVLKQGLPRDTAVKEPLEEMHQNAGPDTQLSPNSVLTPVYLERLLFLDAAMR